MARFLLIAACADGAYRFKAGTTLADSQANALPGDRISARLCAVPVISMQPLDPAASATWSAMGFNAEDMLRYRQVQPTGADSVDA
jgi:hypothetical protein